MQNRNHAMELVTNHPTGWEEYYCPVCQRRIVVRFPGFNKIVLNEGNPEIDHIFVIQSAEDDDKWLRPFQDYFSSGSQS